MLMDLVLEKDKGDILCKSLREHGISTKLTQERQEE